MQNFAGLDKETLKKIAQNAEEQVDRLCNIIKDILAITGTDRITSKTAQDAIDVFDNRKLLSDVVPELSAKHAKPHPQARSLYVTFYNGQSQQIAYVVRTCTLFDDVYLLQNGRDLFDLNLYTHANRLWEGE